LGIPPGFPAFNSTNKHSKHVTSIPLFHQFNTVSSTTVQQVIKTCIKLESTQKVQASTRLSSWNFVGSDTACQNYFW